MQDTEHSSTAELCPLQAAIDARDALVQSSKIAGAALGAVDPRIGEAIDHPIEAAEDALRQAFRLIQQAREVLEAGASAQARFNSVRESLAGVMNDLDAKHKVWCGTRLGAAEFVRLRYAGTGAFLPTMRRAIELPQAYSDAQKQVMTMRSRARRLARVQTLVARAQRVIR
ncbi:TPA: hypothetical protein QDB45_001666 [Burkholderia vietnamiensis]|nr:hypothetical protein [Burkholderia vietnamiensis]